MYIFENERLMYIHVPKTAGTSLKTQLRALFGEPVKIGIHSKLSDVGLDTRYRIFTSVRDPIDRAKSYYRWFKQNQEDVKKYPHKKLAVELDFNEWMKEWFLPEAVPQSDYFLIDGELPTNVKIVRFESLSKDVEELFGIKDLPHIYKTKKEENLYLDEETEKELMKKEHWLYENKYYGG
jgi:hypothetical protein